ncbi:MAG: cytochrome c biogenesis protein ResB [Deltaproteobacteria bacterium]|nr:cytochrome c biogenesis protein ResB [Deltaproteobacteria bacterium]
MPSFLENIKTLRDTPGLGSVGARLYGTFSSLYTSIYLLGVTAFFYAVGTIIAQGVTMDEYLKAGGKYVFLVRAFSLLDIFSSPLFLIAALFLFLNLAVCVYDRFTPALLASASPRQDFTPAFSIGLTQNLPEAEAEARRVLREDLGFRYAQSESGPEEERWVVMEKGRLPYRLITWLYHLGIIVCLIGFLLTYLFAYEDIVTLQPGKHKTVTPSTDGRIQSLWRRKPPESKFSLLLEEFTSEYSHSPRLDYPRDKLGRLAVGLGWMKPVYEIRETSYFPKGWKSRLKVIKDNRTTVEKTIRVNDPLKYGGYTFYQSGYEQTIKVRVDGSPIPLEAKAASPLIVPGLDAPLEFSGIKTGTLFRLDGTIEKITPVTFVRQASEATEGKRKDDDGVRLPVGSTVVIDGRMITFADFTEATVLSYRFDPGFPLIWWSGIFVLAMMCLRFYGRWYLLAFKTGEADGITFIDIHVSANGLLADRERLVKGFMRGLTRNDIRPLELPRL